MDPATGLIQASLEAVSHATGPLQLAGGTSQLGAEGTLSPLTLMEASLELLLPGLASGLYLRQLLLQPQDLCEAAGAQAEALVPDAPASEDSPQPLLGTSQLGGHRACLPARVWEWGRLSPGGEGYPRTREHALADRESPLAGS